MQSPDMIFGENNSNVPKIIRILCEVYDSKYSNKEVDEKIKKIIEGIKQNSALMEQVPKAKENASKKVKSRIEKYFS